MASPMSLVAAQDFCSQTKTIRMQCNFPVLSQVSRNGLIMPDVLGIRYKLIFI